MPAEQTQHTLQPFVVPLVMGDPISHLNLTIIPLKGNGQAPIDYVLGSDAIEAGTLTITEISEGGSVTELLVTSTTDQMVLLLDGEELIGAKQNRILNTSILLLPRANKVKIPVSCVEQGRWRHTSRAFGVGSYSPSRLRARKSRQVSRSLRARGIAASDQGAVWDEVGAVMEETGATSPSMAMSDAVEQRRESLGSYVEVLAYPEGARGVVVAIDGQFAALDLFEKPEALQRVWERLVTGYALDAIRTAEAEPKTYEPEEVGKIMQQVAEVACEPCPSVGIGEDWRFESEAVVGQALLAEGTCVHLSAFPNLGADRGRRQPRIDSPSRRGRRQRRRERGDQDSTPELFE